MTFEKGTVLVSRGTKGWLKSVDVSSILVSREDRRLFLRFNQEGYRLL
jgi:hypothetical protein